MAFINNIFDAFSKNLFSGNAYVQIGKACGATLAITLLVFAVAFVVGGGVSYLMCYEKKVVSGIANGVCFVLRSTPALIILYIFYYVFFMGTRGFSALIAGFAIGLYGAGHFAEIIARSVKIAQGRQTKSVTSKLKNHFYTICLPQAVEESWFPVKRLTIGLFQWTCVVGYIGVNDITHVFTGIGLSNMYPLFALFGCMVFYLAMTALLEWMFDILTKKLVP
jgi:ABC-type amino acid transport system permease subunit